MKDALDYKGYTGSVEVSVEDSCLHGRVQFIDDLISYEGDSVPQIKQAFEDAVDRYLAYCEETGKPANKSYSGSFNVRVGAERHLALAKAALRADASINEVVCQAIDRHLTPVETATQNHVHIHMEVTDELQPLLASTGLAQHNWSSFQNVATKH